MLGSRKLLIFAVVSALLLSLLVVGAFAAVPDDVKSLGGGGALRAAPTSVQYPAKYLFNSQTLLVTKSYFVSNLQNSITSSNPISVTYVSVQIGQTVVTREFSDPTDIYFSSSGGTLSLNYSGTSVAVGSSVDNTSAVFYLEGGVVSNPDSVKFEYFVQSGMLDPTSLLNSLLAVGGMLVSFVVSNPLVLIPLVSFLAVLGFGVIRRLVKGV